ncbi:MAG: hypothetical protein ACI97A_004338 [Planctomycetota bacterium]|jgi:hypothetical protein
MSEVKRVVRSESDAKVHRTMIWIFGFVVFAGGSAFFYKLYEFFTDLTSSDGLRFAGSHLLTYCLVAGGFLFLLAYSFMTGHFGDIEDAKYKLMESEIDYDNREFGKN